MKLPKSDIFTPEQREKLEWAKRAARAMGKAFRDKFERDYAEIMGLEYIDEVTKKGQNRQQDL